MSFILGLFGGPFKLWIIGGLIAAATGLYAWRVHVERDVGRAEVQLKWDAQVSQQRAAALAEAEANAKETLRRLTRQKENQDALDKLTAQNAADRARADAAGLQLRDAAARYAAAARCPAGDPAPVGILAPAEAPALVLANVLGLIDSRSGELAAHADASRAAGLKCQADYDALNP